ncbi:DUF7405 family protein [Halorussus sp. AFM4]|uniref:DUF7405 family protein n=1 Tax=Halorussus sp. AFM4 TaxID=3421651 RepID=UPI003EBD8162
MVLSPNGLPRREFMKQLVAVGGFEALKTSRLYEHGGDIPRGTSEPQELPARQHAWNGVLSQDEHGNYVLPRHHILLYMTYKNNIPSSSDRRKLETALQSLERAYKWSNNGLLFTIGYSPAYFDRFEALYLPSRVDLPDPTRLSPVDNPKFDKQDTVIHLASDHPQVVLTAEQALFGELDSLNGVTMDETLDGMFEKVDRRTGFVGAGLPAKNQDVEGIPESNPVPKDAPLFTGFKSNFQQNQASEDLVTIQQGAFAEGTTQHISKLRLELEDWYDAKHDKRVALMFSPIHAEKELVGKVGEKLSDSSKMTEEIITQTEKHAKKYGQVGHAQKTARARTADDSPLILRRDFDTTDENQAGVHFVSLQRGIGDFRYTRRHMNGTTLAAETELDQQVGNGILDFITVERRGNFLIPPRRLRALPPARPHDSS